MIAVILGEPTADSLNFDASEVSKLGECEAAGDLAKPGSDTLDPVTQFGDLLDDGRQLESSSDLIETAQFTDINRFVHESPVYHNMLFRPLRNASFIFLL